ncbi:rho GTPase-activating protein 44-like isoform X6 [Biomphalaria glabrata]|uniref:Rho GTPase-activating protein 44-like isoform X6 n=1 Tax=Biomphalaria glabrata TaxID=6526 RepID=A0A9W2ZPZ9_BIOGL|nr:rho GTPase-activating protein 44-like isoform X6 [Biomphalaria glabrata]
MFKKENLRKNLLRVKQNIDQNLGRAEKSEVLSEDQQENEKRVELVKHAFQNVTKKAAATLQSNGTDFDKRLKKLPESGLSAALLDSAQTLGTETLLSTVCKLCGECQSNLATEQVNYEIRVETEFINPLQTICDVDIPSIIKLRKALNKSTLDMDSAKSRFSQAVRQSQVPGANMTTAAAKAETIKEEYEEATLKVETIKDNLSIELCNFAAKESDQSQKMLLLLEAQADYHRKALQAIEQFIPLVKVKIDNAPCKPVYGMPLEEHLRLMKRDISLVIEACVTVLLECGLEEEGLFRIAGAAIKLKKLKACFDAQSLDMEEFSNDPHTVAGALKQYLRELPEPLLTFAMHDEFLKAATLPLDQRLQTLWTLIQKLPVANFNNFRYLVKFLAKLAEKSDINKMKPSNIAIVIGPNLLWSETSNAPNMLTTGTLSAIIEAIVTHADWFFPGEFDFTTVGYHDDQETYNQSQTGTQQGSMESLQIQVTSAQSINQQPPSPGVTVTNTSSQTTVINTQQESPEAVSSIQRRATRKPAPPPPPEKPFTVMVTATTALKPGSDMGFGEPEGNGSNAQFQTWPRSAPLASPESPSEQHKLSGGHEKRSSGERPTMPPPDRPERPRLPQTLNPPLGRGHQRSASTGAVMNQTASSFEPHVGVPNAGSLTSSSILEGDKDIDTINTGVGSETASYSQGSVAQGMSHTLGRHSSMKPRPTPPPPPPPVAKESEDTKL